MRQEELRQESRRKSSIESRRETDRPRRRKSRRSSGGNLAVLTMIWFFVLIIFMGIGIAIGLVFMGKTRCRKGDRFKIH